VFLAEHALLAGRHVVVKRFRGARAGEALRREAACVAKLASPFVVRLAGGDLAADPPYLLYEHTPGETLRARLTTGRLAPDAAVALVADLLAGLAHAHERELVHGDVKPENVLVTDEGRALLLDFGLGSATRLRCDEGEEALELSIGDTGRLGALEGTLPYLAPERLKRGPPTPAADVYACGVVLFEALAGRLPGPGDTLARSAPAAPRALDELLARSYCHVDRRFPDARQALAWLRASLPGAVRADHAAPEPAPPSAADAPPDRLRLAAYLGDAAAVERLGEDAPAIIGIDQSTITRWTEALGRARLRAREGPFTPWAREAYVRAAIAVAKTVLDLVEPEQQAKARATIDAHEAWLRCPCEGCRIAALRAAGDVPGAKPKGPPLDPAAARAVMRRLARVVGSKDAPDQAAGDAARLAALIAGPDVVAHAIREALVPWALAG
jgi:serine/threonine protein kinase